MKSRQIFAIKQIIKVQTFVDKRNYGFEYRKEIKWFWGRLKIQEEGIYEEGVRYWKRSEMPDNCFMRDGEIYFNPHYEARFVEGFSIRMYYDTVAELENGLTKLRDQMAPCIDYQPKED
jgi:hypothetical protein